MAAVGDLNVFNRAAQVGGALLHVPAASHPKIQSPLLMSSGCGSCAEFTVTVLQFDCVFFPPLPSEHRLLSATGGTSAFVNNQIWCVRALHTAVCSTTPSFPSFSERRLQLHPAPPSLGNVHCLWQLETRGGHLWNSCTPGAYFLTT